jgi:hypothetical protein
VGKPVEDESALPALWVVDSRAETFRRLWDRHMDDGSRLAPVILNDRVEAEASFTTRPSSRGGPGT